MMRKFVCRRAVWVWLAAAQAFVPTVAAPGGEPGGGAERRLGPARPADTLARPAPAQLRKWVAELADADPDVRERASIDLMGIDRGDLPDLRRAVEESRPLHPNQSAALHDVVIQVYLSGEAYAGDGDLGFLGLRWSGESESSPVMPGIVVTERFPGFCAYRMLQEGDVILALRERPKLVLQERNDLIHALLPVKAGTTLHFKVLRRGAVREVAITLDVRPAGPALASVTEIMNKRVRNAEDYWANAFLPLIQGRVS